MGWVCQQCNKELLEKPTIQTFDEIEPTTIHVFCSETCKKKVDCCSKEEIKEKFQHFIISRF